MYHSINYFVCIEDGLYANICYQSPNAMKIERIYHNVFFFPTVNSGIVSRACGIYEAMRQSMIMSYSCLRSLWLRTSKLFCGYNEIFFWVFQLEIFTAATAQTQSFLSLCY